MVLYVVRFVVQLVGGRVSGTVGRTVSGATVSDTTVITGDHNE